MAQAEIVKREAPELRKKVKAQELTIGAAYTQVKRAQKEKERSKRREENRAKIAEVAGAGLHGGYTVQNPVPLATSWTTKKKGSLLFS